MTHKDKIDKFSMSGVVYKFDCNDCNATYIGQTKRKLITRINEHKKDITKNSLSVVFRHCIDNDHAFDWENTQILDIECSYFKRLTSEMIFIKSNENSINLQSDTDSLPDSYSPILSLMFPNNH